MLRMDSGPDHFSIYLDKVMILQHTRRQPLFTASLRRANPATTETGRTGRFRRRKKLLLWECLRSSPDSIELQFGKLFKLSLLRGNDGILLMSFIPLETALGTVCLRLPVHKNTTFGTFSTHGFEQLKKNKFHSWQELATPGTSTSGCLYSDAGLLPGSNYHLLEAVYNCKTLLASSHRFIQIQADNVVCIHKRRRLVIECYGLPNEIRMGGATTRRELVQKHHKQLVAPITPLPDWLQDGLCLDYAGGSEKASRVLHTMLDAGIHINAIMIRDWAGLRQNGQLLRPAWDFHLDQRRYANLQDDISRYRQADIRTLGYITPQLDCESTLFAEAETQKLLLCTEEGSTHIINSRFGRFAFWDLWKPQAQDFLKQLIQEQLLNLGVHGWVADYGSLLPAKNSLVHGLSPQQARIQYPALWAQLNADLIAARKNDNPLCIMRANAEHCGSSSMLFCTEPLQTDWSWYGLAAAPRKLLKAALSGAGLCFSETGGTISLGKKHRSKELLMRWLELSAFTVFLTSHSGLMPDRNSQIWQDEDMLMHTSRFTRLYSGFKDYRKELFNAYQNDHISPIQPCDTFYPPTGAFSYNTNQFMLGPDILVAPTLQAERFTTTVHLPEDKWIHLWSSREFSGGQLDIESPLGYPAVFFRRDSVWSGRFDQLRLELADT